jgi:AraC family transcriptional regulator of adaptative response/methylated-DNA-[protein]-cysteine methyltransferase
MYRAMFDRDESYEGLFVVAVRSTGIFCRPTCPGRKPKRENVEFYASARDAVLAGYRPCLRCRPLEPNGRPPDWLRPLLAEIERDPRRRWRDADLRARGLNPARIRRWFKAHHGMTFHGYGRARRLGLALGRIREGADQASVAFDHGYESLSGFRDAFARAFGSPPGSARSARVMYLTRILTPLGPMVAGAVDEGVSLLEFADRRMLERQLSVVQSRLDADLAPGAHPHLERLRRELEEYFSGARRRFETPLALPGTKFQLACWELLRGIPYGETTTYAELARAVGRPGAERAVGRANGDNRIAVVIPCHRVIRSDSALAGYGGGLWRKRYLLDHERRHRSS